LKKKWGMKKRRWLIANGEVACRSTPLLSPLAHTTTAATTTTTTTTTSFAYNAIVVIYISIYFFLKRRCRASYPLLSAPSVFFFFFFCCCFLSEQQLSEGEEVHIHRSKFIFNWLAGSAQPALFITCWMDPPLICFLFLLSFPLCWCVHTHTHNQHMDHIRATRNQRIDAKEIEEVVYNIQERERE
jgi:hypothetical protein